MPNLYRQFIDLQSPKPLEVGTVAFVLNGVATVDLPGGGRLQARGVAQAGQRVFVRDGAIEGEAPNLTYIEGEV
ncbi:Flagellum-specific ATP synthase FliI [Comamonas aquatilis]